ncbi:MAG: hypothetical protein ACK5V3_10330 [Bdellovibrionales bacterium]
MKFLILVISTLLISFSAHAERQELLALSCTGANGLELQLAPNSKLVKTKMGYAKRNFETNRIVFISGAEAKLTRITLGRVGSDNFYIYDIYLSQAPKPGQKTTLVGVIGKSVYSTVLSPMGGLVPVPVGFVPSTTVNCNILTK